MKKEDINQLIGLPIESAIHFCKINDYTPYFYPEQAVLTFNIVNRVLRFWHKEGIICGWMIGNIWELSSP